VKASDYLARADWILHNELKQILTLWCGMGLFIAVYPHDANKAIHTLGAGLFVAALYILENLLLAEMKDGLTHFHLLELLLHGTVLPYAVTYVLGVAARQTCQKLCVLGLLLVLNGCLHLVPAPVAGLFRTENA
jgi:hypothetical protein